MIQFLFYFILYQFYMSYNLLEIQSQWANNVHYNMYIYPTELAVLRHSSHIRPNRLSGLVPVLTWPDNRGRTVLGLPLFLLPGSSIPSTFSPRYPISLLCTCPNHLSLSLPNFGTELSHLCCPPNICSFLILPITVTPNKNLRIFNSAAFKSASCLLAITTISSPCNIAGLTTVFLTFPFVFADIPLSQITPDTLLHPLHTCNYCPIKTS